MLQRCTRNSRTAHLLQTASLPSYRKCFRGEPSAGSCRTHINPARRIERYREQRREKFLKSDELARLGDVLREGETTGLPWSGVYESKHTAKEYNRRTVIDLFAVAAIRLLILTGARLREILDAKWDNVDFERGILFLADSKTGRNSIYLNAPALEILSNLPALQATRISSPG